MLFVILTNELSINIVAPFDDDCSATKINTNINNKPYN
jgi:hypothetical protein